jgi:hypothetical protein
MGTNVEKKVTPEERVIELEKRLVDLEHAYQLTIVKFVNYIQAIESSTTLVKDALRNLSGR